MKKNITLTFALAMLVTPVLSQAATLFFDPSVKAATPGDVVVVPIRIAVDKDECVNVASIDLVYPASGMSVETIGRGGSIFPIWLDEKIDNTLGVVHFVVGIPGGYCGAVAGDTGTADTVAKIALQYKSSAPVVLAFASSTQVTLSNGSGDVAPLVTTPLSVTLATGSTVRNEWLSEVSGDKFPPEQFTPEIMKDTTDGHSPFLLAFTTTDKQSGIDHFTVREEDPREFGFHIGSKVRSVNIPTVSPYVLQDQTLRSRIVVRAYDKAGNMTETILPPTNERPVFEASDWGVITFLVSGLIAFIVLLMWSMRRFVWTRELQNENEMQ